MTSVNSNKAEGGKAEPKAKEVKPSVEKKGNKPAPGAADAKPAAGNNGEEPSSQPELQFAKRVSAAPGADEHRTRLEKLADLSGKLAEEILEMAELEEDTRKVAHMAKQGMSLAKGYAGLLKFVAERKAPSRNGG